MAESDAEPVDTANLARDVLERLLEGCQVVGPDYRYLYVNDALVAQARRARGELLGRTMMECYPGIESTAMFAMLERCMTACVHDQMVNDFTYPDGSRGCFRLRFVPVPEGVCILSLDVTADRRAEEQLRRTEDKLRQVQKLEAIGRLAAGVAHDFNNYLSVIISYASLVAGALAPSDPLIEELGQIRRAGDRCADLTRQLLAFARQQVLRPAPVDLNDLLLGMEPMLRRLVGSEIGLTIVGQRSLGRVHADAAQLEQVVLNLVTNARDAMPNGGKLTIELSNATIDEEYASTHWGLAPGAFVALAVSDTGEGMDEAARGRVFEPFFTTKETGKGTGLGLATVFGIIRQSNGYIWLSSEQGVGTTFTVYLPRNDEAQTQEAPAHPEPISVAGSETVLLVEDDDMVRALATRLLSRSGYEVLEARSAGEALLVAEQHPTAIHLLLTDVVMRRMTGPQLAERLAPGHPEMKVLYISGFADESIVPQAVADAGAAFYQKPITPEAFLRKVREALTSG